MVHFLVDASLPRPTADLIRSLGYEATDVRDIGLGTADDTVIAAHAQRQQFCLISRDQDFGNIQDYPPREYFGIVVIHAPDEAGRSIVLNMVKGALQECSLVDRLIGRLAVVEVGRIRIRPAF